MEIAPVATRVGHPHQQTAHIYSSSRHLRLSWTKFVSLSRSRVVKKKMKMNLIVLCLAKAAVL